MIHVLLASTLPLAVFFAAWWRRGRRTSVRALIVAALAAGCTVVLKPSEVAPLPLACLVSGAWAVTPDLPRLWGDLEWYVDLHHRSYCNVWWGHCAIDARDDIDSSMAFPVLFVLVTIAVFAVGWRELARRE